MKQFHLLLTILLSGMLILTNVSFAYDVEYIGIDVDLNKDLTANVNITITPKEPIKQFQWTLFYPIEELKYSANFPAVVVFPEPFTPTKLITKGGLTGILKLFSSDKISIKTFFNAS